MTGKSWVLAVGLVTLVAAPGCVCCRPEAHKQMLEAGPTCDLPTYERQRVHVFLVNGVVPIGLCGMEKLRDRLSDLGYAKVYSGQPVHAGWMAREMCKVFAEEPDARFVLIGYDLGGPVALKLAAEAAAAGLPVDALVLLDPTGKPGEAGCAVRTLVVTSGASVTQMPHAERLAIPDAGHFTIATHPQTVAAVGNVLNASAAKVVRTSTIDLTPAWTYEDAPPARPLPHSPPNADPRWDFLADQPGPATQSLTPLPGFPNR